MTERRVWEVKTGGGGVISRDDVNQALGQVEVETLRAGKARVFGCLMTPNLAANDDAIEAAANKTILVHDRAALTLFDLLSERFQKHAALSGGEMQSPEDGRVPP